MYAKYKSDCITPLVKILWWLSTALGMISKVYPLPYKFLALGTVAPDDLDGMIWLLIFFPFIRPLFCASHTSLLLVLNPFPPQALYTVPLPVNSPSPAWLAWFIFVVQDSAQTTQPHSTSPWLLFKSASISTWLFPSRHLSHCVNTRYTYLFSLHIIQASCEQSSLSPSSFLVHYYILVTWLNAQSSLNFARNGKTIVGLRHVMNDMAT